MTDNTMTELPTTPFSNPALTAKGEPRARIALGTLKTLWFNTGTLCNITCENCYIESSPQNDRLVYLTHDEVRVFLDEISTRHHTTEEIGITGGEPFMNPDILPIMHSCLARGFKLLVLTNAMRPMMRPRVQAGLLDLKSQFAKQLTFRVSIDHFDPVLHEQERGPGSWSAMIRGMQWLQRHFPDHRVHSVNFPGDPYPIHIDATFVPLRPGLIMNNPNRKLPEEQREIFKANDWEIIDAAQPSNDAPPPLCYSSVWLSMNVLILDHKTVIVEESEHQQAEQLDGLGFEVLPLAFRDAYPFGGGLHCSTGDVLREGSCDDYFSQQVAGTRI